MQLRQEALEVRASCCGAVMHDPVDRLCQRQRGQHLLRTVNRANICNDIIRFWNVKGCVKRCRQQPHVYEKDFSLTFMPLLWRCRCCVCSCGRKRSFTLPDSLFANVRSGASSGRAISSEGCSTDEALICVVVQRNARKWADCTRWIGRRCTQSCSSGAAGMPHASCGPLHSSCKYLRLPARAFRTVMHAPLWKNNEQNVGGTCENVRNLGSSCFGSP